MLAVFKKEFKSYFNNMIGYVVIAFVILITSIYSYMTNLYSGYPNFEYSFGSSTFVFLFVIPILTMRCIAEERHSKTDQLLFSMPFSATDMVLGKYFAMVAVFAIPCAFMCIFPIILSFFGTVELLTSYISIIAYFLMGSSLIALGMFVSSLTESQIIAAVLSLLATLFCYLSSTIGTNMIPQTAVASFISFTVVIVLFALIVYAMTKNFTVSIATALVLEAITFVFFLVNKTAFEGLFNGIINQLSPFDRLYNFIYGVFDLSSILYYITFTFIFVFLTYQSVERRRWA